MDYLKYNSHLLKLENSNIFNTFEWISLIGKQYGMEPHFFLVHNGQGEIAASMPFVLNRHRIFSLPFTDYINIVYNDITSKEILFSEILKVVKQHSLKSILINNFVENSLFNVKKIGVLHLNHLEDDFEKEKKKMKYNHKWGVKKAIKSGIHFEMSRSLEFMEEYFKLHLQTRKRQGVPCQARDFFKNLHKQIISKNLSFVGLSFMNKKPIAGGVFLHFNKTITYKYGASDNNYWKLQPNNLMFYEVIKWAVENKFKIFDFGKTDSENKGLRDFKSGWGATESDLYYSSIPEQGSGKLKKIILDYCVKPVIKYSPTKVCELTGKYFYKYNI